MKITKQRLREIIKEELETVSMGADIEGYPERPEEEDSTASSRLAGSPEEQALASMLLQKAVQYTSADELGRAFGIEMTADLESAFEAAKADPRYGGR